MFAAFGWGAVGAAALLVGALVAYAGALLAMVADTLLPESYRVAGVATGSLVAVGFAVSLSMSAI